MINPGFLSKEVQDIRFKMTLYPPKLSEENAAKQLC